jgi:hypothetical protein
MLRIVNDFHRFEKITKSERYETVLRLVRSSRPSDCESVTRIYRLDEAGTVVGLVHLDKWNKRLLNEGTV